MSEKEVAVICLMPARYAHRIAPVNGSQVIRADCGHQGFISKASLDFIATTTEFAPITCCGDCLPRDVMADPDTVKFLIPGSREELNTAFGVAKADQVIAHAKEHGFTDHPCNE